MQQAAPNPAQTEICELLQILYQLRRPLNELRLRYISKQHRILDIIATVFATGRSCDLFAAAFDPEENSIVLAKNGNPTEADISFANEFFAFVGQQEAQHPVDLLTFLLQRRPGGLNKRIRQVHDAALDPEFWEDLYYISGELEPDDPVEFSRGQGFIRDNFEGKDPLFVLKSCRDIIAEETKKALDESTDSLTRSRIYATIINAANVIAHCNVTGKVAVFKSNKVKSHAIKAYRYMDIGRVFREAKRRSSIGEPVSHRWVKDVEIIGSGEGEIKLNAMSSRDVARFGYGRITPVKVNRIDRMLPADKWTWQTTVHTSIHPEIRLAFDLAPALKGVHPVGLSKRSCLACMLWMESNCHSGVRWVPSDVTRRKPDESWAIPGNMHLVRGRPLTDFLSSIRGSLARLIYPDDDDDGW